MAVKHGTAPRSSTNTEGSTNERNLLQNYKKVAIPAVAAAAPYKGGCKNSEYEPVDASPGNIPPRETD